MQEELCKSPKMEDMVAGWGLEDLAADWDMDLPEGDTWDVLNSMDSNMAGDLETPMMSSMMTDVVSGAMMDTGMTDMLTMPEPVAG